MDPSLKLPGDIVACLFDMDGVLTKTAEVHAAAWKEMFDGFLRSRAKHTGTAFVPFDAVRDYDEYVDGRPRTDGTREFLRSRAIELPEGQPDDPAGTETIAGLSNLKNQLVLARIRDQGVEAYPGSVRFVEAARKSGRRTAVVSSSANTHAVLESAGLTDLMDAMVDATVATSEHLAGKPAADTYLAAARRLGVEPAAAAVFEDALAGVAAGRAGGFGLVVGVDRVGQAAELEEHGADIVVTDLADLIG
ncbi:MAG TPA: beta-phosphoglucomutase family hydrolase [Acidimicrobiales bacterium]|nr:beta-phosphoglucomutase family hydrolase [Acidimicrobiales bacterium]